MYQNKYLYMLTALQDVYVIVNKWDNLYMNFRLMQIKLSNEQNSFACHCIFQLFTLSF